MSRICTIVQRVMVPWAQGSNHQINNYIETLGGNLFQAIAADGRVYDYSGDRFRVQQEPPALMTAYAVNARSISEYDTGQAISTRGIAGISPSLYAIGAMSILPSGRAGVGSPEPIGEPTQRALDEPPPARARSTSDVPDEPGLKPDESNAPPPPKIISNDAPPEFDNPFSPNAVLGDPIDS